MWGEGCRGRGCCDKGFRKEEGGEEEGEVAKYSNSPPPPLSKYPKYSAWNFRTNCEHLRGFSNYSSNHKRRTEPSLVDALPRNVEVIFTIVSLLFRFNIQWVQLYDHFTVFKIHTIAVVPRYALQTRLWWTDNAKTQMPIFSFHVVVSSFSMSLFYLSFN